MSRSRKLALLATALGFMVIILLVVRAVRRSAVAPVSAVGVVLTESRDARKETPIANAKITGTTRFTTSEATSDATGFFRLPFTPLTWPGARVTVEVRAPGYEPLQMTTRVNELQLAYLRPTLRRAANEAEGGGVQISNIRVRYSAEIATTTNIGSIAKTFEVVNSNGVPCENRPPCSPDGNWKATLVSIPFDAGGGNQFSKPRASCIAGPCPFTRIESQSVSPDGRVCTVRAINWSDTATFLFEAEAVQNRPTNLLRESYPVIFGNAMTFSVPGSAEGLSIEADVNHTPIVFPLGPDLILAWGNCTMELQPDHSKLFRCTVKPGYRFQ